MTELEIEELEWKSVEDYVPSSQQVRSVEER